MIWVLSFPGSILWMWICNSGAQLLMGTLFGVGFAENMCTLIVMEYCERGNLFEAIHDREFFRQDIRGAPNLSVILRAALDVACAMRYLHSKGIVHGDLKPENVLRKTLAEDDRGYICKVRSLLCRILLCATLKHNKSHSTAVMWTASHAIDVLKMQRSVSLILLEGHSLQLTYECQQAANNIKRIRE